MPFNLTCIERGQALVLPTAPVTIHVIFFKILRKPMQARHYTMKAQQNRYNIEFNGNGTVGRGSMPACGKAKASALLLPWYSCCCIVPTKKNNTSSNLMQFIGELSHRAAVNLICNYPPTSSARLYEPFAQFQSGTAMLESNCRIRNNHIRNQIQNQQETTINKRQATKVGLECPRACY